MTKLDVPKIEPIDEKVFTFNQSKYDMAPKLPFRTLVVGASAGGKTVLISNLLLNIYRNSFERIFVFSPSILIDQNWEAVRKYIKKDLKVDTEKEKVFLEEYDPEALQNIIHTQHKVIEYEKKNKFRKLHSICIIIDDMAENQKFMKYSTIFNGLYTRSRHQAIPVITSVQKYNVLNPIIRLNASSLYVFRLKNQKELDSFLEETSALIDKETMRKNCDVAINSQPYSFLYVNLSAQNINDMFMVRFEKKILVN